MYTIDLRKIPTHIATVPWYIERQVVLKKSLDELGFKDLKWHFAKRSNPYWIGARVNYLKIMQEGSVPFLILEDDATLISKNYNPIVEVPENADMIYLGGTRNASAFKGDLGDKKKTSFGKTKTHMIYEDFDDLYVRIFNMHSAHAILVLNEKGRKTFANSILEYNEPFDICFALKMSKCLTLLRKKVYWYQKDGRNDHYTKFIFEKKFI